MSRLRLPFLVAVVMIALALVVLACGGDEEPAATPPPAAEEDAPEPRADPEPTEEAPGGADTTVTAELDEWSIRADPDSARAGAIRFTAENVGAAPHELGVIRTDRAPDAFPVENAQAVVDRVGEEVDEVADIAPGASKDLTVELEPGPYVLICNLPGHYQQGMTTAFTVR